MSVSGVLLVCLSVVGVVVCCSCGAKFPDFVSHFKSCFVCIGMVGLQKKNTNHTWKSIIWLQQSVWFEHVRTRRGRQPRRVGRRRGQWP